MTKYGMSDEHGTLIGYFDAADDAGARSRALDWLADRPEATNVEVWVDGHDSEGNPYPSMIVDRAEVQP